MPGALKDRLPNRALSGPELASITRWELAELMAKDPAFAPNIGYTAAALTIELVYVLPFPHPKHEVVSKIRKQERANLTGSKLMELALAEFDKMTQLDYVFGLSGAYRRAELTIRVIAHVADPFTPTDAEVPCVLVGPAPLVGVEAKRTSLIALERQVKFDNPNIDRINHGLPIIVQRATPPEPPPSTQLPGEPPTQVIGAPGVINQEYKYDPTQFPAPPAPVDSDISQKTAARLGVPMQTGAL